MSMAKATSWLKTDDSQKPRQKRWHLLYFVLAAFNILTIGLSFSLNNRLLAIHGQSVHFNQKWAHRMKQFSDLGTLAGSVNAPGNDVFDSLDAPGESNRMRIALERFNESADRSEEHTSELQSR